MIREHSTRIACAKLLREVRISLDSSLSTLSLIAQVWDGKLMTETDWRSIGMRPSPSMLVSCILVFCLTTDCVVRSFCHNARRSACRRGFPAIFLYSSRSRAGVQQSVGWVHYAHHRPEPNILLFRRLKDPQPATGGASTLSSKIEQIALE